MGIVPDEIMHKLFRTTAGAASGISRNVPSAGKILKRKQHRTRDKIVKDANTGVKVAVLIAIAMSLYRFITRRMRNGG